MSVVDHSSDAAYTRRVEEELEGWRRRREDSLELVKDRTNPGYGAGHNRALKASSAEFHLVLNPDVELAVNALHTGVSRLCTDPSLTLVSPLATGDDGAQEFLCKRYPSVFVLLLRAFAPGLGQRLFKSRMAHYEMRDACSAGEEVEVELASGCFMLCRTKALQSVDGFSADYFLYFEDFDLSLRLSELGRLLYLPDMQIVHHGGYAARKGWHHVWLFMRSGRQFFRDHHWRWI